LRTAATKQRKEQFGNKNVTTPLIAALDDPDPKVAHNGVVALAQISRNYFKDDRAYAKLLGLVHSKHPLTTRWVIDALIHLRGEASLDDVLPLCTDPSQEARAMVLSHLYSWLVAMRTARSGSIRSENQERLRKAALLALSDDDRMVRGNAASLLGVVGDATVLPVLQKALKKESYWLNEQIIVNAIKGLEGRQ
jgi:HEAT repeat protein